MVEPLERGSIESLRSPLARVVEVHGALGSTQERARELGPCWSTSRNAHRRGDPDRGTREARTPLGISEGWVVDVTRAASRIRCESRFSHHPNGGCRGCEGIVGDRVEARIKWPNDLLAGGKKICGILAESSAGNATGPAEERYLDYVILGVGMNANLDPAELRVPDREVTTIRYELGRDFDVLELLRALLSNLETELGRIEDFGAVLEDWRNLNCTLGREGTRPALRRDRRRQGRRPESEGTLLLSTRRGTVELFEGEVEHLQA